MSSFIFNGVKDVVLFVRLSGDYMSTLGVSLEKHVAVHEKAHMRDVISWNSQCGFAMRCGKILKLLGFLPAWQINRAGPA